MEPYNLYWIEEPVATDDIDGSAEVADALHTPIAGYETEVGLYGFRELIGRGAVDIVQLDIAWSGGFSEGRRIAAYAQAHHRMVAPHAFAGAVLLVASLHFAAAIPNGLVLEWDQNPNALRDELLKEPLKLESDGTVRLPERPGLGIELDRAAVERYRVGMSAEAFAPDRRTSRPACGPEARGPDSGSRPDEQTLFTIGYEKARLADVVATLTAAGVATLIDVRDRPISRRPGFSKRQLAAAIEEAGMRYCRLRALGTPPEGREAGRRRDWDRFWHIVESQARRRRSRAGAARGRRDGAQSPSCLLCYEADWRRCHRRRVAEMLAERHGFAVHHLTVADGAG